MSATASLRNSSAGEEDLLAPCFRTIFSRPPWNLKDPWRIEWHVSSVDNGISGEWILDEGKEKDARKEVWSKDSSGKPC